MATKSRSGSADLGFNCLSGKMPENYGRSKTAHGDQPQEETPIKESLARSWQQRLSGELRPISELWDGIDAE